MGYRGLFYLLNFGMVGVFVAAYAIDFSPEWKTYQKNYLRMAADEYETRAASAPPEDAQAMRAEARKLRRQFPEVKQIIAKDLGRVDRCITCHVGMDEYVNPTLKNGFAEHPYKAHPDVDALGKAHPFQKFGCTSCHQGQGLATTAEDAHGKVHNWETPMLEGKMVQASCARCHADFQKLPGAEIAADGRRLMEKHGCFACHSIGGFGGSVSEPLDAVADKPLERIAGHNFSLVQKDGKPLDRHDWNIQNWILAHMTNDPLEIVPNDPHAEFNPEPVAPSGMPDFRAELGPDGARAIATYLMSMTQEPLPHKYYVFAPPKPEPKPAGAVEHGRHVFEKYGCQGCHGLAGAQGRRNYNAMGPDQSDPKLDMAKGVIPTLTDVVGHFTRDELRTRIQNGVKASDIDRFNPNGPMTPLWMPVWKDRIKGQELEDLISYLMSIAKKEEEAF